MSKHTLMITSVASLGLIAWGLSAAHSQPAPSATPDTAQRQTTANDIRKYLLQRVPAVNPEKTVDTIEAGDGDQPIKKAGVCWYPSIETLKAAHAAGCELLICHEPLYWDHPSRSQIWRNRPPGLAKTQFLEETKMVILRAHDTMDRLPEVGIRDSWARVLGLENLTLARPDDPFHGVYRMKPMPLRDFAREVARRTKSLGQDSVQVIGDPKRMVSRPAIGVGCITPDTEEIDAGADVLIVCFDGASYWKTRERLHEAGAAVITLEHGTTEMPGMESLTKHLNEKFPQTKFQYFVEHARPWTVLAD